MSDTIEQDRLAEALHLIECGCGDGPDFTHEEMARSLLAKAWDDGHNHCFHVEAPGADGNPYQGKRS